MTFPPTRSTGLQRLSDFVPLAVKYAGQRNLDPGEGGPAGVSRLSLYIRTRVITEEETTRAVLARHSPPAGGKFLPRLHATFVDRDDDLFPHI